MLYFILFSLSSLSQIACLNSIIPGPAVYFVCPSSIAIFPASMICRGVLKSGSPTEKFTISMPLDLISAAIVAISKVKEGFIFFTLFEKLFIRICAVFYDASRY